MRISSYNVRCPCSRAFLPLIVLVITTQYVFPSAKTASPEDSSKVSFAIQADLLEEIDRLNKQFVEVKRAGRYDEAIQIAEKLLGLKEKALGPDHPELATSLYDLGLLYAGEKKDYARAEPLLERALSIREKALRADHPDVTRTLNMLGAVYKIRGNHPKAQLLFERALSLTERLLGADHPQLVIWLNLLAALYDSKRDYAKAEPLYQRALSIREKSLGPGHPDVANSLNNLALLYVARGDYAQAVPLLERALSMNERALGPNHLDVATSLDNLAVLFKKKGDYAKAEPLLERALSIRETARGPNHPDVATSLNNLSSLYEAKGDYAKAEPLLDRALSLREKALGPDHPDVAGSLINLAVLTRRIGDYVKAERLGQRALSIREKAFGPDHPDVAGSLDILALVSIDKGDYTKAEPMLQRALSIREKALGADHPAVASSLYDLGWLYSEKGDYAKAEPLYGRALSIEEKALGPDHSDIAQSLNLVAALYLAKGDYARAEPLLQRSLSIYQRLIDKKTIEPNQVDVAAALGNLAIVYHQNKDYAKAEVTYKRALSIDERMLGPNHPDVATRLNNLAVLYVDKGDYAQAERLYKRALAIDEGTLGADHPVVAKSLRGLAGLYESKKEMPEAIALRARACDIGERSIRQNLAAGSERQKLLYLDTFAAETFRVISLHTASAPNDPTALRLALTTLLRRKGRALDAMSDSISLLRRRLRPEDRSLLDQLVNTRAQLAKLTLRGPSGSDAKQYQTRIKSLEQEIEKLETEVGLTSAEFRIQSQPVTIESVRAAIPAGAALIEFASFYSFDEKTKWGPRQYVAYVLGSKDEPSWVLLGEAEPIDRSISALRDVLRDPNRKDFKSLARAVDEKVMRPVRKLLEQNKTVLISPDGALNLIPFGALVDERDRYLIEQYSFTYLTSGRDLLRMQTRTASSQGVILVANPDFGPQSKADPDRGLKHASPADSPQKTKTAIDFSQVYFGALPGTAEEARALNAILPGATMLMNEQAKEAAVKQVNGPTILHIATHGFFLEDVVTSPTAGANRGLFIRNKDVSQSFVAEMRIENPLLRSGLALAGANLQKSGDDDGILTAMEAAGLNLWGTKLVVLSACDTGVGEVKNGEGVYGLRRALVLAGSETQVMSLWPVSDEGTSDLMVEYYKGLVAGQGRREALRRVQLMFLASERRAHPYYWASFIQSGEWANLDGKR